MENTKLKLSIKAKVDGDKPFTEMHQLKYKGSVPGLSLCFFSLFEDYEDLAKAARMALDYLETQKNK